MKSTMPHAELSTQTRVDHLNLVNLAQVHANDSVRLIAKKHVREFRAAQAEDALHQESIASARK